MNEGNAMRQIRVEKVTVNMGVGQSGEEMQKAQKIIERITGSKAIQTKCKVKQPKWEIRPGLPIGLKIVLRGEKARQFLRKALEANDNTLSKKNFDLHGNFGFGIQEYIDLPGVRYDPALGIRGFDVLVTLERLGYRVKRRKKKRSKIGRKHSIGKEEAIQFMEKQFAVVVE